MQPLSEVSYWRSILNRLDRRCLAPVTEFCEWRGEKRAKKEHWFSVDESPIFAFAAVWRPTEQGKAYAFLTCEPKPPVAPIHPKAMAVMLSEEDYDAWIGCEVESACDLAQPFPSQRD